MKTIQIGLLGFGTVNTGFFKALQRQIEKIEGMGYFPKLEGILVRDLAKAKVKWPELEGYFTDKAEVILENPAIDIVIEAISGGEPSGTYIAKALASGKVVITANKAALAERWESLLSLSKGRLFFEASVCGGIPAIEVIKNLALADEIMGVEGILNGTSNYMLTQMSDEGLTYEAALSKAQALGYAEADPGADVDGIDAANKLAILSNLCFGGILDPKQIQTQSLRGLEKVAKGTKLVARADKEGASIQIEVLEEAHPLAKIDGVTNALILRTKQIGTLVFSGPGAGSDPTGTAVLLDLIQCLKQKII